MPTNIVPIRSHVIGSTIPLNKLLTDAALEAQVQSNRQRYENAFDEFERRPSVIALDSSLWARFMRWVASWLN